MAKEKEIQQILKEFQAENREQFKKIDKRFESMDRKLDDKAEETMRYFGVVAESLEDKIKILAERMIV